MADPKSWSLWFFNRTMKERNRRRHNIVCCVCGSPANSQFAGEWTCDRHFYDRMRQPRIMECANG